MAHLELVLAAERVLLFVQRGRNLRGRHALRYQASHALSCTPKLQSGYLARDDQPGVIITTPDARCVASFNCAHAVVM